MIPIGIISQPPFTLNIASGAVLALSLRKLSSTYTGYACKVRRSSDNATTDVAFDYTTVVSGNSIVSAGGNLTTWMGSDNVFVETWYDQSGNSNNATMSTAANQPQLANAGVIYTQNNRPTINFNNSSAHYWTVADAASLHIATSMYFAWVGTTDDTTTTRIFAPYDARMSASPFRGTSVFFGNGPQKAYFQWIGDAGSFADASTTWTTNTLFLLSFNGVYSSKAYTFYKNNSSLSTATSGTTGGTNFSSETVTIGIARDLNIGNNIYGKYSELIIYNTSLSADNLNAVNRSIKAYYGIA